MLGPADSWFCMPGSKLSQSHRLLKNRSGGAGILAVPVSASGESLPCPMLSQLPLSPKAQLAPLKSLWGRPCGAFLGFLVNEEVPYCHQLGPKPWSVPSIAGSICTPLPYLFPSLSCGSSTSLTLLFLPRLPSRGSYLAEDPGPLDMIPSTVANEYQLGCLRIT